MATLGNVPAEAYTNTVKDSFSGNGSATAFTMSLPTVTNDVRVVVENVIQDPTVAYSVSGTTLTFTSAPPTGTNNIYVVHLGPAAMTAVPPAEIADATTFASSLTVQGAFTSVGIDDNADAVALTIDSSENVVIGKASVDTDTTGIELRANNLLASTRASAECLFLNRKTSDGDIAKFAKDGTSVGSIGAESGTHLVISTPQNAGNLVFKGNDTGGTETRLAIVNITGSEAVRPYNSYSDNKYDLGSSSRRFKDAYIGGGVYLGGTGSANKLEDYEEGNHTVTMTPGTSGTVNMNGAANEMSYTKIGRLVTVTGDVRISSVSSPVGHTEMSLPFTVANTTDLAERGGLVMLVWSNNWNHVTATYSDNRNYMIVDITPAAGLEYRFSFSYITS